MLHADRVIAVVNSGSEAARSPLAASWRRSFAMHRLDPAGPARRREPDPLRLQTRSEAEGRLLSVAAPRLDELFAMIAQSGHGVFLTDAEGLVLAGRAGRGDEDAFCHWGLVPGADWSERAQGTNGIGTCLTERRALTIHRDQHYLPQNIGMSCIDAPVFGPRGELVAALDVSSARADQTEGYNQLIGAMVTRVAAQIETDLFRDAHAAHRIVLAGDQAAGVALLAVDTDDIVVGATRAARRRLDLDRSGALRPRPLRDLTGEGAQGLAGAERAAVIRALTRAGGNASAAARDLGIGRATLYRRMKRLGIDETARDLSQS